MSNIDLAEFERLSAADHGLCVLVTTRADGSAQASVVNAGVADHPLTGARGIALVARGSSVKLANLRRTPRATATAKSGWQWVTVEGPAVVIGPDDPHPDFGPEALRLLLRAVFTAAGGTHDDWDEYDRVMVADRRAAVLVDPARVYSNG